MALVYRDCVKQTTTATDDNDLSLDSTAFQGYRTFDDALSDGDTCYYLLDEKVSGQWEIGLGTFTAPSTLARTTVYQSSNSNNKIDLFNGSYPEVSIVTRAATFQTIEDTINATTVGTSLVAEYEVTGSAATTITITDLDLNADIGWTILCEVISNSASAQAIFLGVNADTTQSNYVRRYLSASGTTILTDTQSLNVIVSISAGTGSVSECITELSIVNGYCVWNTNTQYNSSGVNCDMTFAKHNVSQTNVTSLTFTAGAASAIGIGSKIKIYRWLV